MAKMIEKSDRTQPREHLLELNEEILKLGLIERDQEYWKDFERKNGVPCVMPGSTTFTFGKLFKDHVVVILYNDPLHGFLEERYTAWAAIAKRHREKNIEGITKRKFLFYYPYSFVAEYAEGDSFACIEKYVKVLKKIVGRPPKCEYNPCNSSTRITQSKDTWECHWRCGDTLHQKFAKHENCNYCLTAIDKDFLAEMQEKK